MFLFSVSYNDFLKSFTPYKPVSAIRDTMGFSVYLWQTWEFDTMLELLRILSSRYLV